jgi:hypothetical protein
MPSRKQRRRRAKDRRHEYEYVYVDDDGREVEIAEAAAEQKRNEKRNGQRPAPRGRAGRAIEPASWTRVGKRALIFGPLMFITIRILERGEPIGASAVRTAVLLALFLPFSYVMDSMLYRAHLRRTGAATPKQKKS